MVEVWVPIVVVATGFGVFVAAMARKAPQTLGGIGGFVGGVGVFLPLGCATSSDLVSQTVCHTTVGIPMSEDVGLVGGLALGVLLVVLVICVPDEQLEG